MSDDRKPWEDAFSFEEKPPETEPEKKSASTPEARSTDRPLTEEDMIQTITSPSRTRGRSTPPGLEGASDALPSDPGDTVILGARKVVDGYGYLVVWYGARKGEMIRLAVDRVLIGKAQDVHVYVDDSAVSRHHASIRCEARSDDGRGEFVLRDLDSSNGTTVNGIRVEAPVVLRDGDVVEVGSATFVFKEVAVASAKRQEI